MQNFISLTGDQILFNEHPVRIFENKIDTQDISLSEIDIQKTDCGYSFCVRNKTDTIIGIAIPVGGFKIVLDDKRVNFGFTQQFHWRQNNDLTQRLNLNPLDFNSLHAPLVHIITEDGSAYSWSCPNECIITNFYENFVPHVNIEALSGNEITFYVDVSSNYLVNKQRCPVARSEVLINDTSGLLQLSEFLLYGCVPKDHPQKPYEIIKNTRQLQNDLSKFGVDSCIIGSLAQRLNHIPVDIGDIDLMVYSSEDIKKAVNIIDAYGEIVFERPNHAQIKLETVSVDICYDNFNILTGTNYVHKRHGLTYCDTEGLLWLYFFNLHSATEQEHSDDYRRHTRAAISRLMNYLPKSDLSIAADNLSCSDYSNQCLSFCSEMSEYEIQYRDIRINEPFRINCFQKDNQFIYPIINMGSRTDVQIILDTLPKEASWEDVGSAIQVPTIDREQSFSILKLTDIHLPGILRTIC